MPLVDWAVEELEAFPQSRVLEFDAEMDMPVFDNLVDASDCPEAEGEVLERLHHLHRVSLSKAHVHLELLHPCRPGEWHREDRLCDRGRLARLRLEAAPDGRMPQADDAARRRQKSSLEHEAHGDAVVRVELVLVRRAENGLLGVCRGEDLLFRQVEAKVCHVFVSDSRGALEEVRGEEGLNVRFRLGLGVGQRFPHVGRGVDALAELGALRGSVAESHPGDDAGIGLRCPMV